MVADEEVHVARARDEREGQIRTIHVRDPRHDQDRRTGRERETRDQGAPSILPVRPDHPPDRDWNEENAGLLDERARTERYATE